MTEMETAAAPQPDAPARPRRKLRRRSTEKWSSWPAVKRNKRLTFRLSRDELRDLTIEANRREMSLSDLVRQALNSLLSDGR
jgi:hypothetical protein